MRAVALRDARIRDLEQALAEAGDNGRFDRLGRLLAQRETRVKELEARVTELENQIRFGGRKDVKAPAPEADVEYLRRRTTELERALADAEREREEARSSDPGEPPDDLRAVKGVGPAFEKALNALGITRYEQIAAWKPEDIPDFARKLKTKPDRIVKDNWIESARELALEKQQLRRRAS
jgi:predicted flap endonuclease-1-like 5' DNA nuclease